jgi:hypothetical protein
LHGQFAGGEDGWLVLSDLLQPVPGSHEKDAAVPVEAGAGQVLPGGCCVRFLDKLRHPEGLSACQRLPAPDVAIAGLGGVRTDAEGDQVTPLGMGASAGDCLEKGGPVRDYMVGRHRQHEGVRIACGKVECRERQCRRRIAAFGLEDDGGGCMPGLRDLPGQQETVFLVADVDGVAETWQTIQPGGGFL